MKAVQPAAPGEGNLLPVTPAYLLEHGEVMKSHGIPVYRVLKNAEGAMRAEPVPVSIASTLPASDRDRKLFLVERDWQEKVFAADDSYEAELEELLEESPENRTAAVTALRTTLAELKSQDAEPGVKARAIMDTVSRTFLLNKASLKLKPNEVTANERTMAKDTTAIVGAALEMAEDPALMSGLFDAFNDLSNGQTVNHVARVFATYSGFLRYYSSQHQQRLVHTLRKSFGDVYASRYQAILPVPENRRNSDHLLQLPAFEPLEMREYALGAFLHDLGKMGNIDYFESDAAYDPQQIRQHVFLSAGLVLMNYGNEHDGARLLAGDHHNALGHASGYGVTRLEREKSRRGSVETVRILSGPSHGFVSGEALGWLPNEMLAVADVYDAMTDDSRAYKKPMTPAEAVVFLEDTLAGQGKLDPFLVDLYTDYLRSQGVVVPVERGFAAKTS